MIEFIFNFLVLIFIVNLNPKSQASSPPRSASHRCSKQITTHSKGIPTRVNILIELSSLLVQHGFGLHVQLAYHFVFVLILHTRHALLLLRVGGRADQPLLLNEELFFALPDSLLLFAAHPFVLPPVLLHVFHHSVTLGVHFLAELVFCDLFFQFMALVDVFLLCEVLDMLDMSVCLMYIGHLLLFLIGFPLNKLLFHGYTFILRHLSTRRIWFSLHSSLEITHDVQIRVHARSEQTVLCFDLALGLYALLRLLVVDHQTLLLGYHVLDILINFHV